MSEQVVKRGIGRHMYFSVLKKRTIVTGDLGETTHCHDNLGYYSSKALIQREVFPQGNGSRHALEDKLVYI
jgi:hypothetical protein